MGTDFTRATIKGDSPRTIAPNVNAAKITKATGYMVKKGFEMARKRAIPRNTVTSG